MAGKCMHVETHATTGKQVCNAVWLAQSKDNRIGDEETGKVDGDQPSDGDKREL